MKKTLLTTLVSILFATSAWTQSSNRFNSMVVTTEMEGQVLMIVNWGAEPVSIYCHLETGAERGYIAVPGAVWTSPVLQYPATFSASLSWRAVLGVGFTPVLALTWFDGNQGPHKTGRGAISHHGHTTPAVLDTKASPRVTSSWPSSASRRGAG